MNEAVPLPLVGLKRVWSVRVADAVETPTVQIRILVRGSSIREVAEKAVKIEKVEKFIQQYPNAEVVEVTYGGILET